MNQIRVEISRFNKVKQGQRFISYAEKCGCKHTGENTEGEVRCVKT